MRTYVVAGKTRTGTTAMMQAIMAGGPPGLYRPLRDDHLGYPHQVYETTGGWIPLSTVEGRVVKQFDDTLVDNMPEYLSGIHVVYMVRDHQARTIAHPDDGRSQWGPQGWERYWEDNADNIRRISQDPRVEQLVIVDFDEFIDDTHRVMSQLLWKGWNIDVLKASAVVQQNMRHAKRGDFELKATPEGEPIEITSTGSKPDRNTSTTDKPVANPIPTDAPSLRIIEKHLKRRGL